MTVSIRQYFQQCSRCCTRTGRVLKVVGVGSQFHWQWNRLLGFGTYYDVRNYCGMWRWLFSTSPAFLLHRECTIPAKVCTYFDYSSISFTVIEAVFYPWKSFSGRPRGNYFFRNIVCIMYYNFTICSPKILVSLLIWRPRNAVTLSVELYSGYVVWHFAFISGLADCSLISLATWKLSAVRQHRLFQIITMIGLKCCLLAVQATNGIEDGK